MGKGKKLIRRYQWLAVIISALVPTVAWAAYPLQGDTTAHNPYFENYTVDETVSTISYPSNPNKTPADKLLQVYGECVYINNTSQQSLFVPLKSSTEWVDFKLNAPTNTGNQITFSSGCPQQQVPNPCDASVSYPVSSNQDGYTTTLVDSNGVIVTDPNNNPIQAQCNAPVQNGQYTCGAYKVVQNYNCTPPVLTAILYANPDPNRDPEPNQYDDRPQQTVADVGTCTYPLPGQQTVTLPYQGVGLYSPPSVTFMCGDIPGLCNSNGACGATKTHVTRTVTGTYYGSPVQRVSTANNGWQWVHVDYNDLRPNPAPLTATLYPNPDPARDPAPSVYDNARQQTVADVGTCGHPNPLTQTIDLPVQGAGLYSPPSVTFACDDIPGLCNNLGQCGATKRNVTRIVTGTYYGTLVVNANTRSTGWQWVHVNYNDLRPNPAPSNGHEGGNGGGTGSGGNSGNSGGE